ncbi:MAG: hypothetical protein IJ508_04550, partial [Oscillospiraceae bacterium]|nr:hypothetical protein [Oscillospiraceae bacterium]
SQSILFSGSLVLHLLFRLFGFAGFLKKALPARRTTTERGYLPKNGQKIGAVRFTAYFSFISNNCSTTPQDKQAFVCHSCYFLFFTGRDCVQYAQILGVFSDETAGSHCRCRRHRDRPFSFYAFWRQKRSP